MMEPVKLKDNEILIKHGPSGGLIRRLQRYALLGWVLFFIMLFLHFVSELASNFMPRPILAVDASGRILGNIEYLNAGTRSDDEIIAASKRFASSYMSLNAATIFDDYAQAMNMMSDELLATTQQSLKTDNYLARVAAAKARSWLEFSQQDGARIVERHGLTAQVRLAGNIVIDGGGKDGVVSKPFDMTLTTESVARNTLNTSGIKIVTRKDN
jgi:hypothetical protein